MSSQRDVTNNGSIHDFLSTEITDEGLGIVSISPSETPPAHLQSELIRSLLQLNTNEKVLAIALFGLESLSSFRDYETVFDRLQTLTKAVIVAAEKSLLHAACDFALSCDLIVISSQAKFSALEVRRCLQSGYVGNQYRWISDKSEELLARIKDKEELEGEEVVGLGIVVQASGEAKTDALRLGAYLCSFGTLFAPYTRLLLLQSPRYQPKL